MAAKPDLSVKASEPDQVDSYMRKLKHPLADVVEALCDRELHQGDPSYHRQ